MTSDVFLDTNILLYALVPDSTFNTDRRLATAEKLLADGGVISVQVLSEFSDVARRKLGKSWSGISELLNATEVLCGPAVPLTAELHKAAVKIAERYGFRIYDSMIVAAAAQAGCTTVYSEDMQHGQMVEGVRIENPFKAV
jgi:predicted nucleic acid-binding protein